MLSLNRAYKGTMFSEKMNAIYQVEDGGLRERIEIDAKKNYEFVYLWFYYGSKNFQNLKYENKFGII